MERSTQKLISSICYFSIFFAGFILPLVVYLVIDNQEVKRHAKLAFLSHLVPLISVPICIVFVVLGIMNEMIVTLIAAALFIVVLNFAIVIWNIVKGIKVLKVE
jgi:hypothetical protein